LIDEANFMVDVPEVERVLKLHDAVEDAAVVGVPSSVADVAAFIVARRLVTPRELMVHCARRLPQADVPVLVREIEALPRDATGAVNREALRQNLEAEAIPVRMQRDRLELPTDYAGPQTDVEWELAEIWRDTLNFDRVGLDDNFFDLGGDSLNAVTISSAVSDAFDIDFKPSLLMERYTIRLMAEAVGAPGGTTLPANVVAARSGSRPPLFIVHGQWGITFLPPQFMSGFHEDQPVYIFEVPGFDGSVAPHDRIEDIAADYLNAMLEIQPNGPYLIAAFCAGSWIAVEMVKQMRQRGLAPDRLVFMDPGLHSAMDDEFLVNRGVSGANIPVVSPIAAAIKLAASDSYRRAKFLFRTGHWVNGQDRASFALPAVREFWIDRQRRRLDPEEVGIVRSRVAENGSANGASASDGQETGHTGLEAAAVASAKLQLAFRTYNPDPYYGPIDLIVSRKTARGLENKAHPINRVLPNRRLIVFGETHMEAVAGRDSRNARLIQEMVDETVGATSGSHQAVPAPAMPSGGARAA
jgi:acyl carrier protein